MGQSGGGVVHEFGASLRLSQEHSTAWWWEPVYRAAFPDLATLTYVSKDGPVQRDGVDRVIVTTGGRTYKVEEKVRSKDYEDFFLEYWSDYEARKLGWAAKDSAADFIAYAFIPSARCYLLPFLGLWRAMRENGKAWIERYGERVVPNRVRGRAWTTKGVAVPILVVLDAIRDGCLIRWDADGAPRLEAVRP